jgi:signal transduction histidine kinase
VSAARANRNDEDLGPLVEAQVGRGGVSAIGLYDAKGTLAARAGDAAELPNPIDPASERVETVFPASGRALLVAVPSPSGPVAVLVRTDASTTASGPLVRLFALYTGVVGLALLVFAYLAMTRLVVRPVDALSRAARRVADGARRLEPPPAAARELGELGEDLARMTERLRADEEELRKRVAEVLRQAKDLERAQERLVRSERLASVGRLSAGLAHEIGNPISAILGFQELLLAGGLDEAEQKDFLERMRKETERIHRVLRDLLDFARPAHDRSASDVASSGDVAEAASDVAALVKPQRAFRDVALTVAVAADLPKVMLAHERLLQVMLNLLLNAADAVGERGKVVLRASLDEAPASGKGAATIRIEVEDSGPGVSDDILPKLFEPFATSKEVGKGTGLGLAVCRGLVEAAGGTITLAPKGELGGARFWVDLPISG